MGAACRKSANAGPARGAVALTPDDPDPWPASWTALAPTDISDRRPLGLSTGPSFCWQSGTLAGQPVVVQEYEAAEWSRLGLTDATLLSHLSHVNVVSLLGVCEPGPPCALVLDATGGLTTLQAALFSSAAADELGPLAWGKAMAAARGLFSGLNYLHTHFKPTELVHGNIKSTTVLISHGWQPKLSGFGRAHLVGPDGQAMAEEASVAYSAPEVLTTKKVLVRASDVYSAGILLTVLFSRREPFVHEHGDDIDAIYKAVFAGERPRVPEWAPSGLGELIEQCVRQDLLQRPEAKQVLKSLERLESAMPASFVIQEEDQLGQFLGGEQEMELC